MKLIEHKLQQKVNEKTATKDWLYLTKENMGMKQNLNTV